MSAEARVVTATVRATPRLSPAERRQVARLAAGVFWYRMSWFVPAAVTVVTSAIMVALSALTWFEGLWLLLGGGVLLAPATAYTLTYLEVAHVIERRGGQVWTIEAVLSDGTTGHGCAVTRPHRRDGPILLAYLATTPRGHGIGRILSRHITDNADNAEQCLKLTCRPRLESLYRRHGFTIKWRAPFLLLGMIREPRPIRPTQPREPNEPSSPR